MADARGPKGHEPHNPKRTPTPPSDMEKDPAEWVSGNDPMTGAQTSYLKNSEECNAPDEFQKNLTKAEVSKRIDALKKRSAIK